VTIKTKNYVRRSFPVEGVQVTAENMEEVAEWCYGSVLTGVKKEGRTPEKYIKIRVHRPEDEDQSRAFVGAMILYSASGFRVYSRSAFEKSFQPA
jgi:hypothetical protein